MKRTFDRADITNLDRLIKTQHPDSINHGSETVELRWHERLAEKLETTADRLTEIRIVREQVRHPMGKLHEVAERIKRTKASLESEADKLMAKLDGVDKKAPDAFSRGHAVIDQQSSDIDTMDAELRQLSNIPLEN